MKITRYLFRTTPVISRLDFRYPSQFGENGTLRAVKELSTADQESTTNQDQEPIIPDRTVNYRKCILPFVLGVALMLAGIIMRKLYLVKPTKSGSDGPGLRTFWDRHPTRFPETKSKPQLRNKDKKTGPLNRRLDFIPRKRTRLWSHGLDFVSTVCPNSELKSH